MRYPPKYTIVSFFLSFMLNTTLSQETSGIITYEGTINQKYVDSFSAAVRNDKEVSMAVKQQLINALTNTDIDVFTLNFKGSESYYSFLEALSSNEAYNVGSKSNKTPHYYNNLSKKVIKMSPSLGNIKREALKWKITKETKQIGDYTCYKAVGSETFHSSSQGTSHNERITAWFALSIPLSFGPLHYVGLPGLVLELQRQRFTLRAREIKLNPEKNVKIVRPKKNAPIIDEEEVSRRIKESQNEFIKN